ncbi:unnamed protein product, partial [Mesorhabditis belari]|uniref:C-type lectin domain-containing protein n=1 Tax=Mesorhabditis belari TaxID=2138241 RepID=A0AAF3F7U4_9BILA
MPEMTEELPEKSVKRIEESAISLKKIAQLEADLEEMKKDKDIEMSRWTAKIAQIEAKLEADFVDERERNRELERKIAEAKRKNDDLEAQLRTRNTEVREGKTKIGELDGKINALQSKISGFETQIECEQKERSDEFTKINSKISQSDDRSTKIGADLKEIDSEVAEMSRKMAKLETDLVDERERNRELERKIAETKRKNDDLEAQLDSQVAEMSRTISARMAQNTTDLMEKITKLEADLRFERIKTVEIAKLQADLNRPMTFSDLDGWSYLAKTASWYKAFDQEMTFDEAEAYCTSRKIHLVSIHSQEENDFVQELAETVRSDSLFWIGLKGNPNKGNAFEWTDGSSVVFRNWHLGQPDSYAHALLDSYDGEWWSASLTSQWRFICKTSSQF